MAARKTTKKLAKTKSKRKPAKKAVVKSTLAPSERRTTRAAKKTVAKKRAAKKAALGKRAVRKSSAEKTAATTRVTMATRTAKKAPKPVQRRDHAGHIDPAYAAELRAKSTIVAEGDRAFFRDSRSSDDLAEELGKEAVSEMTTGQNDGEDRLDQHVAEEEGGPFVESTANEEFANDVDDSNPEGATREPFPTT